MKQSILRESLRIARKKNTPEIHPQWGCYHHFCFIVQNNKIIEWGFNRQGPPLIERGYRPISKIHAETDAYNKAKGILDPKFPFEAVNVRLNKRGELRLSKPCSCCFSFLRTVGCRTVWFSTEVGFASISLLQ